MAPLSSVLQCFPPSASVEEFWPERDFFSGTATSKRVDGWTKLATSPPKWLPTLTPIKDWPGLFSSPYVLRRANLLNFGQVDALNTKPSKDSTVDLLVTLPDLASCLGLDLELVGLLLVKLRVILYSPNSRQAELLEGNGKDTMMKPVPLVKVDNFDIALHTMSVHQQLASQVADVVKHKAEIEVALRGKHL